MASNGKATLTWVELREAPYAGAAVVTCGRTASEVVLCAGDLVKLQRLGLITVRLTAKRPGRNSRGGAGVDTPHHAPSERCAFLLIAYKEMLMREIILMDADRDGETMKALVVRYDRDRARLELAVPNTTVVFTLSRGSGERFTGTLGGRTFYWDAPRGEARQKSNASPNGGAE